jgi:hypothetical protein
MKTEKIYTQHEENKEWANSLSFYKDDLKILTGRLEEVASKNTSKEVLALVEHFQNQLLIQKGQIDILNHSINIQNDTINTEIKKNSVAVDHRTMEDHSVLRENMKSFEMIFKSLRIELMDFLGKWM